MHGHLIEIAGKKGAGKTQVSFLVCAINSVNNKKTIYIDGSGSFRPERIKSIIDNKIVNKDESKSFLKNIAYQRIYDLHDITKLLKKITILDFDFAIFDDIIPMFMYKFKDNGRLEVRRFIRDLSLITLSKKMSIIFTNIIFEKKDLDGKNIYLQEIFFHDIIRYTHFKFYLQSDWINNKVIKCKLVQPITKDNSIDCVNI